MKTRTILLIGLIATAIATRFFPHVPNFTAVGAVALFGGVMFKSHLKAFLIPVAALFLSDLILNNLVYGAYNEGFTLFTQGFYWIYGAFLLTVVIGKYGVGKVKPLPLVVAGLGSSLVFYLITNFGAWAGNPLYPQNLTGLAASYLAGLPFLLNQVLGMFFYGAILFSVAYALLGQKATARVNA